MLLTSTGWLSLVPEDAEVKLCWLCMKVASICGQLWPWQRDTRRWISTAVENGQNTNKRRSSSWKYFTKNLNETQAPWRWRQQDIATLLNLSYCKLYERKEHHICTTRGVNLKACKGFNETDSIDQKIKSVNNKLIRNCAFLNYWAASCGKFSPKFRDNPSGPIFKGWPLKIGPIFCSEKSVRKKLQV